MAYYGGMASLADILGAVGGSMFGGDIAEAAGGGTQGKIAAALVPALLSGGVGALTGGTRGMMNAIPAGLMGYLGATYGSGETGTAANSETPTKAATTEGTNPPMMGSKNAPAFNTALDPTAGNGQPMASSEASPKMQTASTSTTKSSVGSTGGIADLMKDPMMRYMLAMQLANMFSGTMQNESSADYQNQQNQQNMAAMNAMRNQNLSQIQGWYR